MIKEGLNNALLINYFKYILTVDDIKKFKPNQEVYKLAPTAFNCEPNEITFSRPIIGIFRARISLASKQFG